MRPCTLPTSLLVSALLTAAVSAQITPGNLVVVRVGDGTAALSNSATAIFLDQFDRVTPAQPSPLSTIAMPTAPSGPNLAVTNSGTATSEGFITQSSDGNYFVTVGYSAAPGTAGIVGTTSAANPRVITRIALDGTVDSSTSISNLFSANNIRSAFTEDGSQFWAAGANSGIVLAPFGGTTGTSLNTVAPTNLRCVGVDNGQLYTTSGSGTTTRCINAVGTGVPTTTGQTLTILGGMTSGTASPYDFWFADAQTVYVADDRNNGSGGIQKWTESAGTWTLQFTLAPALNVGCRGLSGIRDLSGSTLYAVTTTNQLVSVLDTGAGSTFTTLATAPTNTAFRGVRFVRTPSGVSFGGTGCTTSVGIPTIGTAGGAPVSGNGNFGLAVGNTPPLSLFISVVSIGQPINPFGLPLAGFGAPACANLFTLSLDILLAGVTDLTGAGIAPLGLPTPDASLWGLLLGTQHLVFDPAFYPGLDLPVGNSDGMQLVIGN
jgi:hypothetical protein